MAYDEISLLKRKTRVGIAGFSNANL